MREYKTIRDIHTTCCLSPDDEPDIWSVHFLGAGSSLWFISPNVYIDILDTVHIVENANNLREVSGENFIS